MGQGDAYCVLRIAYCEERSSGLGCSRAHLAPCRAASQLSADALRNTQYGIRNTCPAFTLIELMVVVAIMGIVMTISIPTLYRQLHPESMRKAVSDVMEACSTARARAILDSTGVDLVIHPAERQFDVVAGASRAAQVDPLFSPDVAGNDWRTPPRSAASGGGGGFSVRLSDKIMIEGLGINGEDYTEDSEGRVRFYPNGTSDEFSIVLLSDRAERRNITLEVVTGLADVESNPAKFKAR